MTFVAETTPDPTLAIHAEDGVPAQDEGSGLAPRVSIGLPVYNGERFLAESLESLLAQTYRDFELIISDNASNDRTEEICRAYAARDPRIRYYREESNHGMAWNFNRVFALARGEFFKWAAYDDLHAPTFLEQCIATLDRHPEALWCMPRFTHIGPAGRPLNEPWTWNVGYGDDSEDQGIGRKVQGRQSDSPSRRFRSVLLGDGSCLDNYALIRRQTMAHTALQVPYYGGDKVFVAELCLYGRYRQLPETLFFVRAHPEGSGALATEAEQQQFMNPRGSGRFCFTRLHLLCAYLRAWRRAKLSPVQRVLCLWAIGLYLFQVKKWGHVLHRIFSGTGTGGGYREAADRFAAAGRGATRSGDSSTESRTARTAWMPGGKSLMAGGN